ncbi:DUF6380 family protein [Streptomyces sp. SA15]|nr:DUF6380 family protein [Streptomyces sp. SA15]
MDNLDEGDVNGAKRRATHRCGTASLTETVGRARSNHHGGRVGKDAQ